jgi:N4-gp56 family major capsid protein
MATTIYGDISPRTAAFAVTELLKRALPYLVIERFGQAYPLPKKSSKTAKWRRYFLTGATGSAGDGDATANFFTPVATTPLVEGVTPTGKKLANQDYTATLLQYGDYVTITDVIIDTHEDQVLQQALEILGESAAQTIETLRFNVLKAGTNVYYQNGGARNAVNTAPNLTVQRQVTTSMNRQNAKKLTQVLSSTPQYAKQSVEAAYIALCHPDSETDVRGMTGYINPKDYGSATPFENEIGTVEQVRYLTSTVFTPFPDAGGAKGSMRSTTGTSADVYPILVIARDAYGLVPLKGENSMHPMVVNPKPAPGDPLAQRGTVGWKTYNATVILQDSFLVRWEVAATA